LSEAIKKPLPQLKEREKLLADGILGGKNTTQAARDAGYAEATAKNMAQRLRLESAFSDRVNTYLEIKRSEVMSSTGRNLEDWLKELEAAKQYAVEVKNANARVKAVELEGKALGHLKDDKGGAETPFFINITIPGNDAPHTIDVTSKAELLS